MSCINSVGYGIFPEQGEELGKRVRVCFHYNTEDTINGIVVRDDISEPFKTIIALDDGCFVLSTECQYTPVDEKPLSDWMISYIKHNHGSVSNFKNAEEK